MNYIDRAILRAFLYKSNYGLEYKYALNLTGLNNIKASDVYAKYINVTANKVVTEYDLIISIRDSIFSRPNNAIVVVIRYEENKLIIKEI